MLVISRKTEEYLQIGDDIIVKVIKSSNGSVKIGIEAPGNLRVLRGELNEGTVTFPQSLPKTRRTTYGELTERSQLRNAEAV